MSSTDQLIPVLKKLRLSGVLQTMEIRTQQAASGTMPYEEYLQLLLGDEVERRESKQLELRLRRAQFEHDKTLEGFDFSFNSKVPKAKVFELATCNFIEKRENILLIGPSGVGKSHIAQALGHRACRQGYSTLFVPAKRMLGELRASRADQTYERKLQKYVSPELLIVDDLGLRPMRGEEPEDLYEIIRSRYEYGSIILTSNRAVDEWYPLFGDALMASAAMDRLLHHAHVIEMPGNSYRTPPRPRSPRSAESQMATG